MLEYDNSCTFEVRISGEITTKTTVSFEKALTHWDQRHYLFVILNSPGGDIAAAMKIGRLIRKSPGRTMVEGTATCASACVLLFGAGISRIVFDGAKIGVHRPALAEAPCERDMAAVKAASDQAARALREYAAEMNISERLIDDMLVVPPENIRWLSEEDRKSYGLAFLDPVYAETATLALSKKYKITPGEYRARYASAMQACKAANRLSRDEFYGILEGKSSECAQHILAGSNFFRAFDPQPAPVEPSREPSAINWPPQGLCSVEPISPPCAAPVASPLDYSGLKPLK
jgi:ATP-dependent protease ClpP protease subunit